ncbi:MAG: hypothetical protein QNJ65_07945 [Xenococcaceae cyanobacterium MO_234.B1]|nr:hypothetical protein [Xenococcaceae cyanobacterium MO_234.B1]
MSAQSQARSLMNRHHHLIKNRQQSLLRRTAAEIGVEVDKDYWAKIQGKPNSNFSKTYDRSNVALS